MKLCLNVLKSQPLTLTVLAAGIAFFGFSQKTHAGFEWIPPAPAPKVEPTKPAMGGTMPMESETTDDAFLPIPGSQPAPAPLAEDDMAAAPAADTPMEDDAMVEDMSDDMAAPADGGMDQAMSEDSNAPMPITSRPQMKTLHTADENTHMQSKTMAEPVDVTPMPMDIDEPTPMMDETAAAPQKAIMPADTPDNVKAAVAKNAGQNLQVDPYPVMNDTASAPSTAYREPFAQTPVEEKDVVGFGTDIPLALALQQVAPAGYAFSFGETINPGAKVSWSGGDNWVAVMERMIQPLGLQAQIQGRVIFVNHQREVSAPQPITPATIKPAAGEVTDTADSAPETLRRASISDPGQIEQAQPKKTIKVLSERQPVAKIEPAAGEEHAVWEASKGDSLKETLESWSKENGKFDVNWTAIHDYTLQSDVLIAGEMKTALKSLLEDAISKEEAPNFVLKHNGDNEKPTLIVKERV